VSTPILALTRHKTPLKIHSRRINPLLTWLPPSLYNAEMRLILAKLLYTFDLELQPESIAWSDQEMYNLWHRRELMVKLVRAGDR
jgi:hypothetical protein